MEWNNFFTGVFCVDFDKLMNVLPFRNLMFSGISDSVVTVEIYWNIIRCPNQLIIFLFIQIKCFKSLFGNLRKLCVRSSIMLCFYIILFFLVNYDNLYLSFLYSMEAWLQPWLQGANALSSLLLNPRCCLKVLILNKCQLGRAGVLHIIQALSG